MRSIQDFTRDYKQHREEKKQASAEQRHIRELLSPENDKFY